MEQFSYTSKWKHHHLRQNLHLNLNCAAIMQTVILCLITENFVQNLLGHPKNPRVPISSKVKFHSDNAVNPFMTFYSSMGLEP